MTVAASFSSMVLPVKSLTKIVLRAICVLLSKGSGCELDVYSNSCPIF